MLGYLNKQLFLSLLTLALASFSSGQTSGYEVARKVLEHVNHLRDSLKLDPLVLDQVLNEAGEDHAYYIAQKEELTHFQKTFSKETPSERVLYYKGNRTYVGENVAFVTTDWNTKDPYPVDQVAKDLYAAWFHSPPHYENMINPVYSKMGLGTRLEGNKVYSAQVFSSNEVRLPAEFRNSDISWGVRPGEITCKDDEQVYETMFFANSVRIEGEDVYLYFHDLNFFKHVIENDNDGLAIDIVLREQLPCGKENQFHISQVYDGEMQRPIYKNDIYRNNISTNPKKIHVKIGEVPKYLANKQWEANVIVINDNILCDYSVPANVPSDIFPLLNLKPYHVIPAEEKYVPRRTRIHDSIHVELYYERSDKRFHAFDDYEFYKLVNWGDYAKNIKVDCFASVEGKKWHNLQLLEEREKSVSSLLEEYGIDRKRVQLSATENWKMMNEQTKRHNLHELNGMDEEAIRYYFRTHSSDFYDSLLFEQRKTHIYALVDTTINVRSYDDYRFVNQFKQEGAMTDLPWNKLLYEDHILPGQPLSAHIFDSLYTYPELRTNLLAAGAIDYYNVSYDSLVLETFLEEVNKKDPEQVFNYAHFLTHYWFAKFSRSHELMGVARTITPDALLSMVNELSDTELDQGNLNRLRVNILLSGIHYYVTFDNWTHVNAYFDKIAELVKAEHFSAEEAMELALFCNHFYKFRQAIEILDPFYDNNSLNEDGIFILAATATLRRHELDPERYHQYMKSAKKANHPRYCTWLDTEFQIQRDEYLKKDFCTECR